MSLILSFGLFYFIGYLSFYQKKRLASFSGGGDIVFVNVAVENREKNIEAGKDFSPPEIDFSESFLKLDSDKIKEDALISDMKKSYHENAGDLYEKIDEKPITKPITEPDREYVEKADSEKKFENSDKNLGKNGNSQGKENKAGKLFSYEDLDEKIVVLKKVMPIFPFRARRRGIEKGKVVLKFIVNQAGYPENIEVVSSTHPGIFDDSAKTAVAKWRFKPGKIGRNNVKTILYLPVKYELQK